MSGTTAASTSWSFRPRPDPPGPRARAESAEAEEAAALRVAHGLGVSWGFELRSGASGGVRLRAEAPAAVRWVERALIPAYPPGSWARRTPESSRTVAVAPRALALGVPRRGWPDPLVEGPSRASLFDRWALAFAALPRGAMGSVWFEPRRSPGRSRWEVAPVPRPMSPLGSGPLRRANGALPAPGPPPPGNYRPALWWTRLAVALAPDSPAALDERAVLSAAEAAFRSEGGNGVRFRRPGPWRANSAHRFVVSESELLNLWPGRTGTRGADWELVPLPAIPLGRTLHGSPVGLPLDPTQGRHLAVLGETGMGKSSLLVALAVRAARVGGVIVLDPIGDTAEAIRAALPTSARERVEWIAASEEGPGFNALEGIGASPDRIRSERRLNDLVHALRRVRASRYADSAFWGPRLEEVIVRALRAAAELPDGTLREAHQLLATGARAPRPETPVAQQAVRELADQIRVRPDDAEGARRLLHEVVRSAVLERWVCATRGARRTSELLAPGRIVLVSGEADGVGESVARYLLAILLGLVWSELLARTEPSKTFVVLDEAQWFAHESLAEMLRLARRRNAHVVVATQAIGSLPEEVREATWTNVADFVTFRGSPEEAREFARLAPGIPPEAVLALPRGHAVLLEGKGGAVRWIRTAHRPGTARPPSAPRAERDPAAAIPEGVTNLSGVPDPLAVVEWLASSPAAGSAETLTVSVEELRTAVGASAESVRAAGAWLGRAGALRTLRPRGQGTVWTIDLARLRDLRDTPSAGTEGAASREP
ncbi:MAG TPA: DUF87 domain-containing protein [Thermoplasmata archaeon]|nr:DUF87 domain-containing protein [Thermoplasmata archaeon]